MSLRVLLVKSRSLASKVSGTTPPLGLLSVSAYLKRHVGADVRVLETRFVVDPRAALRQAMQEFQPRVVGLSALTAEAFLAHELVREARGVDPEVAIWVGGPHATSDPEAVLANEAVDVAVRGEGEETARELARIVDEEGPRWRSPTTLASVQGISYRAAPGEIRHTEPRPFLTDLDALPFPDWDAIDLTRYWTRPSMATLGVRPYATMFTSRGCPYRCTFCHQVFGKRFRSRSPESVLAEIDWLMARFGPIDLEVLDDIANFRPARIKAIFQGLLERPVRPRISFPNGVRTDILDAETIDLYGRAGPGEVSIAVETASPRLQRMLRKNLDLDRVAANTERLVAAGAFTRGFFMLGFPSETAREMMATIRWAARSPLHLALFFAVNPYPETPLYDAFARRGKIPDDVDSAAYEYFGAPFNGSDVPDEAFRTFYRYAYHRFYFDPLRIYRILRDRPHWRDLPPRVGAYFRNLISFRRIDEHQVGALDPERW